MYFKIYSKCIIYFPILFLISFFHELQHLIPVPDDQDHRNWLISERFLPVMIHGALDFW